MGRGLPLWTTSRSRRIRERQEPIPGSEIIPENSIPTPPGTKTAILPTIPPLTVWEPYPHRLVIHRLGFMEPARGGSCPSGQCRGLASSGDDKSPSPDHKSFHKYAIPTPRGRKRLSLGSVQPPTRCFIVDQLGLVKPARVRVVRRGKFEVTPHQRRTGFHPRIKNRSIHARIQHSRGKNGDPSGRYRLARCGNPTLIG